MNLEKIEQGVIEVCREVGDFISCQLVSMPYPFFLMLLR